MADVRHSRARLLGQAVLVAAIYAAVGTLSLRLARDTGLAAPIWPAAGVAFAFAFQRGWPVLPGVAVGSLLVNLPALLLDGSASALVISTAIALGAAIQAQAGAVAVRRVVGTRPALDEARQILVFMALAGPLACLVAPTIGVVAQVSGGVITAEQALNVWLTWWVGDSIGVVVFAPLTLMLLPEQADIWRGRRLKVAIPSLLISVGTVAVFLLNASLAQRQVALQLEQRANAAAERLASNLDRQSAVLEGIRSLFDASDEVTRADFAEFTSEALSREDGLQALAWSPVVTSDRLAGFVSEQQDSAPSGFTPYERAADGTSVPVAARDDYILVLYIEPVATNKAALGYDLKSDAVRNAAIAQATDSGEVVATAPITLVQETGSQQGILAVVAVYDTRGVPATIDERRAHLTGIAAGVYRLGDLLRETFADPEWGALDLTLLDITDPAESSLLAERPAQDLDRAGEPALADRVVREELSVSGRTWALDIRPTAALYASLGSTTNPGMLIGGLLVAGLLEAFLLLVTGTERRARRAADVSDHAASHDVLTGLLNRRGFAERLTMARTRLTTEGSPQFLLYIDLDDFKDVNDAGGHDAGDALLQGVAGVLKRHVRERDSVARIGGDEFAIILNNCGAERGQQIASTLVDAISAYRLEWEGAEFRVGASVGATPITIDADHDITRKADRALYEAKREGKGTVHLR